VVPGEQTPPQAPLMQTYWQAEEALTQLPVESQVRTTLLLQSTAPGVQPVVEHTPAVHPLAQAAPLVQLPVALQVCGTVPLHCCDFGTQVPVHVAAPALTLHTYGQAPALTHLPVESQDCGTLPLHCWVPGTQIPEQAPAPLQTKGQALPELFHAPVESHV
jgi:hypothetical protein